MSLSNYLQHFLSKLLVLLTNLMILLDSRFQTKLNLIFLRSKEFDMFHLHSRLKPPNDLFQYLALQNVLKAFSQNQLIVALHYFKFYRDEDKSNLANFSILSFLYISKFPFDFNRVSLQQMYFYMYRSIESLWPPSNQQLAPALPPAITTPF